MVHPPIIPQRFLEQCYDGPIPDALSALADAGTYQHYVHRLACAAERRFYHRLITSLRILAAWRCRDSPLRWHRLQIHSESVQIYRHRAREAFDLCG